LILKLNYHGSEVPNTVPARVPNKMVKVSQNIMAAGYGAASHDLGSQVGNRRTLVIRIAAFFALLLVVAAIAVSSSPSSQVKFS
jgi:hypothetical protein